MIMHEPHRIKKQETVSSLFDRLKRLEKEIDLLRTTRDLCEGEMSEGVVIDDGGGLVGREHVGILNRLINERFEEIQCIKSMHVRESTDFETELGYGYHTK